LPTNKILAIIQTRFSEVSFWLLNKKLPCSNAGGGVKKKKSAPLSSILVGEVCIWLCLFRFEKLYSSVYSSTTSLEKNVYIKWL